MKAMIVALTMLFAAPMFVSEAVAAPRCGASKIQNPTGDTLNYFFKWTNNPNDPTVQWQRVELQPGHFQLHYWNYESTQKRRSPRLWVKFDSDMGPGISKVQYWLQRNAIPEPQAHQGAKTYYFSKDGVTGRYIDLKTRQ